MNIDQVRNGRELIVNLGIWLFAFPDEFTKGRMGNVMDGADGLVVTEIRKRNSMDSVDLTYQEFQAVKAARDYYYRRLKKWIAHQTTTKV